MPAIKPPPPFQPGTTPAENWARWRHRYENYVIATGLEAEPIVKQRAVLLCVLGDDGNDIYDHRLTLPAVNDALTPEVILNAFTEYYKPTRNEVYRAYEFHTCVREAEQSFDDYIGKIKRLAVDCEYGALTDRLIRDRLVAGANDRPLQERLFQEPNLSLEKAISMCRAAEISRKCALTVTRDPSGDTKNVSTLGRKQNLKAGQQSRVQRQNASDRPPTKGEKCFYCGRLHPPAQCPAYGKKCNFCGKQNHFAEVCQAQKKAQVSLIGTRDGSGDEAPEEQSFYIGSLRVSSVGASQNRWVETCQVEGGKIQFQLDTGAEANVLPWRELCNLGKAKLLKQSSLRLETYTGTQVPVKGEAVLKCHHNNKVHEIRFVITQHDTPPILGLPGCLELNLIRRIQLVQEEAGKPSTESLLKEFPKVFSDKVGCLPGLFNIKLQGMAEPTKAAPRPVPKALQAAFRRELDWLLNNDIISKVDEPTDWIHPIIVVPKQDGTVRICLDPRPLNKVIKREHYRMPTPRELLNEFAHAEYFTLLDGTKAFMHMKLDEESSKLCTFITPWGRYRFKRMPFGIASAPEQFQKAMERVFEGVAAVKPYQDDILVWGTTRKEHDERLRASLKAAEKAGLTLNRKKLVLATKELKYIGHIISKEGIRPDPAKVEAIRSMPMPTTKEELHRIMGMITYLAQYIPNYSEKVAPLRALLKKDTPWTWNNTYEAVLEDAKRLIQQAPVLAYYDPEAPLILQVDASSYGMGATLLQGRPVAYASATLTQAQRNYPQIEKEMLALVFGSEHFHYFTFGRKFTAQTDHKPLLGILNKPFDKITPRLQRLVMRFQRYDAKVEYVPGKHVTVADTLSRAPVTTEFTCGEGSVLWCAAVLAVTMSPQKTTAMQKATKEDPALSQMFPLLQNGWPAHKRQLPGEVRPYWVHRHDLHETEGLICRGNRLVIPRTMRQDMLATLHATHRGMVGTKGLARQFIYWPNMNMEIEHMVEQCPHCQRFRNSKPREPIWPRPATILPWEEVAMDFCETPEGKYLVLIDDYSRFLEVKRMHQTTAADVIEVLQEWFSRHGFPQRIMTDNGPPFGSEAMMRYLKRNDIMWHPSSPKHPQSNGLAERAVQTFKKLLNKTLATGGTVWDVLRDYRNTPSENRDSPASLLYGRAIRSHLPSTFAALKPKQPQNEFHPGQPIWMQAQPQGQWLAARVERSAPFPRSYLVEDGRGGVVRRNSKHLRPREGNEQEYGIPEPTWQYTGGEPHYHQGPPQEAGGKVEVELGPLPELQEEITEGVGTFEETRIAQKATRSGRQTRPPAYLKDYVQ